MAQPVRTARQADVLIIGSSLTALLTAEFLRQQGRDVVVLEGGERLGAHHRPLTSQRGHLPVDLAFLPATDSARALLDWVSDLLRLDLFVTTVEAPPVTYEDGQLRTFVGFGDHNPSARDEVTFYLSPVRFEAHPSLAEVAAQLAAQPSFVTQTRKEVTKVLYHQGQIEGVEVNGEEIWRAPELVWAMSPTQLLGVLSPDAIEGKHRARFAKAHTWTSVSLHLHHHKQITTESGVHVLYGSGNEGDPVVGRLWPAGESGQHSMWMTFVASENADDPDQLGHALRHLKRQIKRAHPHILDDLIDEKLLVSPDQHGHMNLRVKDPFSLPELKGFWFASPLLSDWRGPLAAVDAAYRLCQHFPLMIAPSRDLDERPAEV